MFRLFFFLFLFFNPSGAKILVIELLYMIVPILRQRLWGVSCHFFSYLWEKNVKKSSASPSNDKVKENENVVAVQSLNHVRLFATPWTIAQQALLSVEFSRKEYWSVLPFPSPGDLPDAETKPRSPALAGILYHWATMEALKLVLLGPRVTFNFKTLRAEGPKLS